MSSTQPPPFDRADVLPWRGLPRLLRFTLEVYEDLIHRQGMTAVIAALVSLLLFWHLYTPIHELLHVAGCLLTGGTVEELQLGERYGAVLLAQIFPFVTPGSDYAGQLTQFTYPNYWAYAVIDLAPYLLSLPGVYLIARSREIGGWLFGPALILTFIPLLSATGDFYELASLPVTSLAERIDPSLPEGVLRSDDVFALAETLDKQGLLRPLTIAGLAVTGIGALASAWLVVAAQLLAARRLLAPATPSGSPSPAPAQDDENPPRA